MDTTQIYNRVSGHTYSTYFKFLLGDKNWKENCLMGNQQAWFSILTIFVLKQKIVKKTSVFLDKYMNEKLQGKWEKKLRFSGFLR